MLQFDSKSFLSKEINTMKQSPSWEDSASQEITHL